MVARLSNARCMFDSCWFELTSLDRALHGPPKFRHNPVAWSVTGALHRCATCNQKMQFGLRLRPDQGLAPKTQVPPRREGNLKWQGGFPPRFPLARKKIGSNHERLEGNRRLRKPQRTDAV